MVCCTLACLSTRAATLYVWKDSPSPAPPYSDWSSAATTIQDAVDAARAGDLVLVTNGVYASGGRAVGQTVLVNRVAVDKPITLQSINGPQATIVEGAQSPGGGGEGAIRCVYLANGAVLSGFTLTNGATRISGDISLEQSGGGVWCETNAAVTNCVLTTSFAWDRGGGAYRGTLYNCILINNNNGPHYGGGTFDSTLYNCTLAGNGAYFGGGACGGTLNNCTLTNNWATYGGGADACWLNNCTLSGNTAWEGGGAYRGELNSCALTGNLAYFLGGGALSCTLNNCIVYLNQPDRWNNNFMKFCCASGLPTDGISYGIGNITNAPLFVDYAGGNFHLQSNSPCINAGNNSYVTNATDLDGNPRIAGGTVDIGAYEFQAPASHISYAWLQQYGLPINFSTDTADPDGDSVDNYHEWLAHSDPTNPLSFPPLLSLIPYGSNVVLTWTTNAVGFTLQSSTNPASATDWSSNSPPPVVIGGQNVILDSLSSAQKFYRLSQ